MYTLPIGFVYRRGASSARVVVGIGDCVDNPTPLHTLGTCALIDDEPQADTFVGSQAFDSFLFDFLRDQVPKTAAFIAHARELGDGALAVVDMRSPQTSSDDLDYFCTFDVQDGKIVPGSFSRNMGHQLMSEHGFFCLHVELYSEFIERLAPILRGEAAA